MVDKKKCCGQFQTMPYNFYPNEIQSSCGYCDKPSCDGKHEFTIKLDDTKKWKPQKDFGDSTHKDTNPKDACGTRKAPISTISGPVLAEIGIAMLEGARKYGRHNYRVSKVRASVYYDAAFRHLISWFEGEDIDPDSGLSHVTKAIASLVVLRDAIIQDKLVDDRPPTSPDKWLKELQPVIDEIFRKYPEAKEAYINETKRLERPTP